MTKFRKPDLVNISLMDKHRIMTKIKHDTNFLESSNIMDYSLLLAVETNFDDTMEEVNDQENYENWLEIFFKPTVA